MYEFDHDYMVPKYGEKSRLCYMDANSFVYHIKTHDFKKDIVRDVEWRFDTSGYCNTNTKSLPFGNNKKIIDQMKNELGEKFKTELLHWKVCRQAMQTDQEMCSEKTLTFYHYKKCLYDRLNMCREHMFFQNKKYINIHERGEQDYTEQRWWKKKIQDDQISALARGHYTT